MLFLVDDEKAQVVFPSVGRGTAIVAEGAPNCYSIGKGVNEDDCGFDWWKHTGPRLHIPAETADDQVGPYPGYRTVLRLEELCPRARRIVRGARVELDVSKETNLLVAAKTAARAQLFEARRSPRSRQSCAAA